MRPHEVRSLTAIRGIAALWVVMHHLTLFYRYPDLTFVSRMFYLGFNGVDIFFVLSGFILTKVYYAMDISDLRSFFLRRILRIYPLHLAVLIPVMILAWNSIIWPHDSVNWPAMPYATLLLQPFTGYHSGILNGVSWSAGVELSCYLAFPLALFACRGVQLPTTILLVLIFGYVEYWGQRHFGGIWSGPPALKRGWTGFGLGMSIELLAARTSFPRPRVVLLELAAGFILLLAIAFDDIPFIPLASGGLIWMMSYQIGPISRALSTKIPVFLGTISFSIYMVHFLLIDIFQKIWPVYWHPALTVPFLLRELAYFGTLIVISSITYQLVEHPAQNLWRPKQLQAGTSNNGRH